MLRFLYRAASHVALFFMKRRWKGILEDNRAALSDADVVVVMSSPRAFGTLFGALDETRRMYAGKKVVFIYHLERVGHNPLLGTAVPDITVIAVPRKRLDFDFCGRRVSLPPNDWHDPMGHAETRAWLERNGKSDVEVLNAFMLWRSLPVSEAAAACLPRVHEIPPETNTGPYRAFSNTASAYRIGEFDIGSELHFYGGWNTLRAQVKIPPMTLPADIRDGVLDKLAKARNGRPAKLCGFHTRYGGDVDKIHRDGSPLELYIPAIRKLIAAGYQIMIQGDRSFHPRFMETFDGMVVDPERLGIDKNVFRLFCGCHSDIFVGDWPVAPQFAASNDIPTLVVNAWPWGWGVNGSQVFYRRVRGADGAPWSAERCLRQGALITCNTEPHHYPELFNHDAELIAEIAQCSQISLSEDELLDAVTAFLEDLESGAPETDAQVAARNEIPAWTPIAMATDCRLNRAWIDRYWNT